MPPEVPLDEQIRQVWATLDDLFYEPRPTRVEELIGLARLLASTPRGVYRFDLYYSIPSICADIEQARQEAAARPAVDWATSLIKRHHRKPVAAVATEAAVLLYEIYTGELVTRVQKPAKGGHLEWQEAGGFACFLKGVFEVFGIRASAAAQVKLWKQKRFAEFAAEYREEIEMAANSIGEAPNSIT